jgi:hypothetical protein
VAGQHSLADRRGRPTAGGPVPGAGPLRLMLTLATSAGARLTRLIAVESSQVIDVKRAPGPLRSWRSGTFLDRPAGPGHAHQFGHRGGGSVRRSGRRQLTGGAVGGDLVAGRARGAGTTADQRRLLLPRPGGQGAAGSDPVIPIILVHLSHSESFSQVSTGSSKRAPGVRGGRLRLATMQAPRW